MAPDSPSRLELIECGRDAYAQRDWGRAYDLLARADAQGSLGEDDLEWLAWSASLGERHAETHGAFERLCQHRADAGNAAGAARAAFWLALHLLASCEYARASGWLGRARRLIEQQDCVEHGYLLLPSIMQHFGAGDDGAAGEAARNAAAIGERFGDIDLVTFARNYEGRALIRQGEVAAGLGLIDEVMIAVLGDELSPLIAGLTYCSVIATCHQIYAVDRAREWTAALARWCGDQPELVAFTGSCLVHRAQILHIGGDWNRAIDEAERACARLSPTTDPTALADAHYEQAEIRRLRGEIEAAEIGYRATSQLGGEPQPGLALLRLQQGRVDEACAAIRRALDTTTAGWRRARFLPACVEITLASGRLEDARAAVAELDDLVARYDSDILGAMADHARGAVCIAEGEPRKAVEPLRRAFAIWQRAGAPYIAARIRVLVGRACRELGDPDGAQLELDAARPVFEELGAAPDLRALDRSGEPRTPGRDHGLTTRELEVLRLVASGKTNKAIAHDLFLSERTIDRHVSNIFNKLDVSTRAAATAFAYEHGLV